MKSAVLRKRFFDLAVADVLRAVSGGSLVGSNALALCVLDYLAFLRTKDKNESKDYKQVVSDYLVTINDKYVPMEIYAWRCSLVHTYAEAGALKAAGLNAFQMTHRHPELHLERRPQVLVVNVDTFVADVVWATWSFFVDTDENSEVEERAKTLIKTWSPMDILAPDYADAQQAARTYESMHSALRDLDRPSPSLDGLRSDITGLYPIDTSTPTTTGLGGAFLSK
jgi:hypothetical protein